MNISDEFRVGVSIDEAWKILLDIERIAPCLPGAQLQEVEGDEYRGIVKVKVGPITAQYKGVARIVEADESTRRITIKAEGRDTRGQGNASAMITAALSPDGDDTRVSIDTDLNVTGKVAQFGRGVMADVSSKLLGQFVTSLESNVLAGDAGATSIPATPPATTAAAPTAPTATEVSPAPSVAVAPSAEAVPAAARTIHAPEAEAVDLVRMAGGAVARRVMPALAAAVVIVGVVVWLIVR